MRNLVNRRLVVKVRLEMQNMNDHRSNQARCPAPLAQVSGSTDVYLILGDPVEQVLAPESFNPIFADSGIDAVLVPAQVAPQHLDTFVKSAFLAANIKGMWLTIPHKGQAMSLLDHCSALARMAGAVNAIRRNADGSLEGGLFDGEGFVASLSYFKTSHAGKRVLLLGAGGAAAAIGASLALPRSGGAAAKIAFFDPTLGKAAEVASRIAAATQAHVYAADSNDPSGFDLVVNASPLGLNPADPLPCDVSRLAVDAVLIDIVMKNQPSPVVQAARARGLNAQPGFEMLIHQTHMYLDFFGFTEAAQGVRLDATFLREKIYPAALQHEIRRPERMSASFVNVPLAFN
jgi:shikimate dehydrogenase